MWGTVDFSACVTGLVGSYSQLCLEAEKPPGESSKLVSKIHTPMLQSVWMVISVEDLEGGAVRMEGISSL